MSGQYFVSPQKAVLALDDAYQSGSVEKVLEVVAGQDANNFRYFTKPETPEQSLSTMVLPFEISIAEVKPQEPIAFVFSARSTADIEHGVAFKIVDWKVVKFGQWGDIL